MGMKNLLLIISVMSCLFLFSCKKEDPNPDKLPPATQSGENTFGCYVNGEVWLPKGRPSTFRSNLNIVYDPGHEGGTIDIRAYRTLNNDSQVKGYMQIGSSHIGSEGVYNLDNPEIYLLVYRDSNCYYNSSEEDVYSEGKLEITRLDIGAGIVAGMFEFTLAKQGCDTIQVTKGRFDYKL